jgi:AcrR family transcriptional regulator
VRRRVYSCRKTSARFLSGKPGAAQEASLYVPKISPAHEQQRRAQILAAAMACFARQGYHATSMDDVVRECGLSVGAIYSYFGSKEDLFLALSDDRAEQTLAYLNELFRRPGPMADKSREAVDYFFRQLSDDLIPLARVNVEFLREAAQSERLKERQQRRCATIRQFLCWLLTEAQQRGEVRADVDVPAAAELMLALNEGILLLAVAGLREIDLATLKPAYISLLNSGLASPDRSMFSPAGSASAAFASVGTRNGTHHEGGS